MVKKEFGCDNCGHELIAISPDDSYTQFFIKICCEKSIERKIKCSACNFMNIRYWCVFHRVIVSASIDVEERLNDRYSDYF